VGTAKRERKKANRAARHQREVRRERLVGLRRRVVRWGVIVVGAIAAVVAIAAIGGAFSDDSEQVNQRVDDPTTEVVEDVSTVTAGEEASAEACPPTDGSAAQRREFDAYPPMCIDEAGSYSAVIETNFGSLTVELDADAAPLTVNNFVTLARYGYFDDTVCHRIIPDFVVQCGDPTATGTGGPGYRFPDELPAAGDYQIGSLAMANSGPDTNGSQFFIISGDRGAALPPNYSLFGQVTVGLDDTLPALDAVGNPESNGMPPLEEVRISSVIITEG